MNSPEPQVNTGTPVVVPGLIGRSIGRVMLAGLYLRINAGVIIGTIAICALIIAGFIYAGGNVSNYRDTGRYEGIWSGWRASRDSSTVEVKNLGPWGGVQAKKYTDHNGTWTPTGRNGDWRRQ